MILATFLHLKMRENANFVNTAVEQLECVFHQFSPSTACAAAESLWRRSEEDHRSPPERRDQRLEAYSLAFFFIFIKCSVI